jgi:hypothetical protein
MEKVIMSCHSERQTEIIGGDGIYGGTSLTAIKITVTIYLSFKN